MDNGIWSGAILLAIGVITFVLVVAAEAGVIAGVRERALREPTESRVDALRRFYQERQLTLSSLALAHNLALVGITAVIVFVVLREWDDSLPVLAATVVATVGSVMLLQTFAKWLVREDPERWQRALKPFVAFVRIAFRGPVLFWIRPWASSSARGIAGINPRTGEPRSLCCLPRWRRRAPRWKKKSGR